MNNVVIEKGAEVEYAIIDRDVRICAGAKVGGDKENTELTVLAAGTVVEAKEV
jgi:ADP-glucose pyrophosphorylase